MAETLKARMAQRHDTAANWTAENPVLLDGEIGIEKGTKRCKIGNGVTPWNGLTYSNVTPEELGSLGGGDMTKAQFATNAEANDGYVDKAKTAQKLETARNIALSGDVTGSGTFDGSGNLTLAAMLKSIVTAGTYTKIIVDAKGLVVGFEALTAEDIPSLTLAKITDAGTAAARNTGTAAGSVVIIEANGYISDSLIPPISLNDIYEVDTVNDMLALNAKKGDMALVNSETGTEVYILKNLPATDLNNWLRLNIPTGAVLSVNGLTGAVSLSTTDIPEGTNLYYTEARFNASFAGKSSADLSDGSTILRKGDFLILDGGNASDWNEE